MPDEENLSLGGQFRSELDENPGGKIGIQPFHPTIALGRCEASFPLAAGKGRSDFDGG